MLVVGLTGGIASGKSTISKFLQELGAVIIDADYLARQVVEPGTKAWVEIGNHFGQQVINKDQTLNRKKLAEIVFNNPQEREVLNKIIHPQVIHKTRDMIELYKKDSAIPLIVVDAPLLIEAGMTELVDEVWVIEVDVKTQIQRITERDNVSRQQAISRISSQMPTEDKLKFADRVINTDQSLDNTLNDLRKIWSEVIAKQHDKGT